MIDRAIGITGIGLAFIFGATEYFQTPLPDWASPTGAGIGILMLGISVGLIWAGHKRLPSPVERAMLRLHIYANNHTPERLSYENIFRWYYLSHIIITHKEDGTREESSLPTLFVTFNPDVKITTLKVRSPDMMLPRYEVKEFNQKFAIIAFSETLPEGTLEIRVEA